MEIRPSTQKGIVKGDSISLELTIGEDITDWKIRCEIYDDAGQCIRLATSNSGGADSQIEVTDATNGVFIIKVEEDKTTNFCDKGFIEVEIETDDTPPFQDTILRGEFDLIKQRIDWKTP